MPRTRVALLSNPRSTGNIAQLPRIREFCAAHPDLFHYEVEQADQIGEAMKTIARVNPKLLVINGGDGTVQAALTELYNGGHFDADAPPPVAVLPSGKTNLIAMDLGVHGDPVEGLQRLLEIAQSDLSAYLVERELIALRSGANESRPVIGMFLGGAGLADIMLYCRNRIYPLGLPNGLSHALTAIAVVLRQVIGLRASFLPPEPQHLKISKGEGTISGRYALLAVTTLEKLLLQGQIGTQGRGPLKFVAVEQRPGSLLSVFFATLAGKLGRKQLIGVHVEEADEISIEGDSAPVILDGETFSAEIGKPIFLSRASPLSFVRLAA